MEQKDRSQSSSPNQDQNGINKGENHVGRAGQDDSHDISHMDQQEGAMNNGVLGGNFQPSVDESAGTDSESDV